MLTIEMKPEQVKQFVEAKASLLQLRERYAYQIVQLVGAPLPENLSLILTKEGTWLEVTDEVNNLESSVDDALKELSTLLFSIAAADVDSPLAPENVDYMSDTLTPEQEIFFKQNYFRFFTQLLTAMSEAKAHYETSSLG